MGIMDNMKDQSSNIMDDPSKKEQIEQMAKEHGISIDEAKERFTKNDGSQSS